MSWATARSAAETRGNGQRTACGPGEFWRQWMTRRLPGSSLAGLSERSALDLKGLTYAPTGRCWPPPRRRCPRRPAASGTGTTATPGSATRPSRSGGSTRSASTARPTTSSTSSPTLAGDARATCRSCTGSAARGAARGRHSTTWPGTRTRDRYGSATAPTTSDQHDVWGAVLDSVYLHTQSRDQPARAPRGRSSRARSRRRIAHWRRARPRHLGGARRAAALHRPPR